MNTNKTMDIVFKKSTEDEHGFVGIKIENGKTKIFFPYGYPIDELTNEEEKEQKKQIRYLMYSICESKIKTNIYSKSSDIDGTDFLYDCIFLVEDYLNNGLYQERKKTESLNTNGRVNWKKTLTNQTPMINFDNGKVCSVYFNNLYKNKTTKFDNIYTYLEIEALKIAKNVIGFLYPDFYIKNSGISNPEDLIPILKNKMIHTFNDREKRLFDSIINIIMDNKNNISPHSIRLGTTNYEVVWERMLRKVYGNADESRFFPKTTYVLKNKISGKLETKIVSNMMPDLLFVSKDTKEYYVIDAKYYAYCENYHNVNSLPKSDSISKQIIYQQKIEEQLISRNIYSEEEIKKYKPVKSMFILPYNKNTIQIDDYLPTSIFNLSFKGFGTIEAKGINNRLFKIGLAFKDTKDLITEYNEGRKYHYTNQYFELIEAYANYYNYVIDHNNY